MTDKELNIKIAETVMEKRVGLYKYPTSDVKERFLPEYSISIKEAMRVVEEMRKKGFFFKLVNTDKGLWIASFSAIESMPPRIEFDTISPNAASSICLAALKAVGERDGD